MLVPRETSPAQRAWTPWAIAPAVGALSLLGPSQPGYDGWAWLTWGRETLALELDTVAGPAWKPLAVAVTAPLSLFGGAAPELWLAVARAGALAAVLIAARLARRLSGGSVVAAIMAGLGVALSEGWAWHAAVGNSEGLFLALALAGLQRGFDGRHSSALALALAAALLRPESWPFLALYGAWLWRRDPSLRPWVAATALVVPVAWFVPELLGSGDALRSSERARVPNPGAPALSAQPALTSLAGALAIPLAPLLAAALIPLGEAARDLLAGARHPPLAALPAVAGIGWVLLVALMAEAGFSGEARYAWPGVALIMVSGAVGIARLVRARAWTIRMSALLAVACFSALRLDGTARELGRARDEARLYASLEQAVTAAGGGRALLECGRPVVGVYRGTALAWALRVPKRVVGFDSTAGTIVFRSRLRREAPVQPAKPPGGAVLARTSRWEVVGSCIN